MGRPFDWRKDDAGLCVALNLSVPCVEPDCDSEAHPGRQFCNWHLMKQAWDSVRPLPAAQLPRPAGLPA